MTHASVPARVPAISACYALFAEHGTPVDVVRHCLRVNQVAVFLAEALQLKGRRIDLELVDRASLLHSLNKHRESPTVHHAEQTARELEGEYPVLADVIRKSPALCLIDAAHPLKTLEEKVVSYADRRVLADEIVPIETKLYRTLAKELLRGLGSVAPDLLVPLVRLEQELFAPLDFAPMDIQHLQGSRLNHDERHLILAGE